MRLFHGSFTFWKFWQWGYAYICQSDLSFVSDFTRLLSLLDSTKLFCIRMKNWKWLLELCCIITNPFNKANNMNAFCKKNSRIKSSRLINYSNFARFFAWKCIVYERWWSITRAHFVEPSKRSCWEYKIEGKKTNICDKIWNPATSVLKNKNRNAIRLLCKNKGKTSNPIFSFGHFIALKSRKSLPFF